MIKNIIFDLGNVLLSFVPSDYIARKNYPEIKKAAILSDIFGSAEWQDLDKGIIKREQAIEAICRKSSLKRHEIIEIFNLRHEILLPVHSNIKLLPELKELGFRLYFLSNFPADLWDEVKGVYDFFKYFDGGIISADAKLLKPDPEIYKFLLDKFSIRPEECLYIDDIEVNVRSAESLGMKGIATGRSHDIREEVLKALG
jgi:putative hydrolase of the HAD superfamily